MDMIVKYSVTDSAIEELRDKYRDVPTIETRTELSLLKKEITVVRSLRTGVETRRKELKKDALEYGRKVDSEARRITMELMSIETPMKVEQARFEDKARAEKEEKARIERERIERIQEQIRAYDGLLLDCVTDSADEIRAVLEGLEVPDEYDYQEFAGQHAAVLNTIKMKLADLLHAAEARELKEKEAEEKARLAEIERQEAAERDRVAREERDRLAEIAQKEAEEKKAEQDRLAEIERVKIAEERKAFMEEQRVAMAEAVEREKEMKAEQTRLYVEKRALEVEKNRQDAIREAAEAEEALIDEHMEKVMEKNKETKEQVSCETESQEAITAWVCPHCGKHSNYVRSREDAELDRINVELRKENNELMALVKTLRDER